jgi:tRNA dimethylallyltransferase
MHLIVIGGPTATGKTSLAVDIAHRWNADVISADSRQVYRGLDLGTGKDLGEFRKFPVPVRHHLIDIVEPGAIYTLYQYQQDCYRVVADLSKSGAGRRDVAVMVGGTGMYMEAVLRRYRIANVPENPAVRESLSGKSREELSEELTEKDPALALRTDLSSKKRIIRALEILDAGLSGEVAYSPDPEVDFTFTAFAMAWEREDLRARIDARLQERLRAGMVEEVAGLMRDGVEASRLRLLGMEYREITDYLLGVKDQGKMVEDLRHEIHLLAKRQETYFRGMEKRGIPIHWLRQGEGTDIILETLARRGFSIPGIDGAELG